jgi:hypothetical protein
MAKISHDAKNGIPKHIIERDDGRVVYVMSIADKFVIVDPYMSRHDSAHDTFDEAVSVATQFLEG